MSQSQTLEKNSGLGAGQTRFQLSSPGTSVSFVCQAGTQCTLHQGFLGELNASFDLALERFLGLYTGISQALLRDALVQRNSICQISDIQFDTQVDGESICCMQTLDKKIHMFLLGHVRTSSP